jgi:hypothetical protein
MMSQRHVNLAFLVIEEDNKSHDQKSDFFHGIIGMISKSPAKKLGKMFKVPPSLFNYLVNLTLWWHYHLLRQAQLL